MIGFTVRRPDKFVKDHLWSLGRAADDYEALLAEALANMTGVHATNGEQAANYRTAAEYLRRLERAAAEAAALMEAAAN